MKQHLKDNAYYWVRQQPTTEPSGRSTHPHWEPMLWRQGRFWHRGLPPDDPGIAKEDLADIGEIIDRAGRKADQVYDVIHNASKAATKAGTGLPVRVAVSGFDSNLPPLEAPTVIFIDRDGPTPLPLTPAGDLDWCYIAKHETVTVSVDTSQGWLELTTETGGFSRHFSGPFRGAISINPSP